MIHSSQKFGISIKGPNYFSIHSLTLKFVHDMHTGCPQVHVQQNPALASHSWPQSFLCYFPQLLRNWTNGHTPVQLLTNPDVPPAHFSFTPASIVIF